MKVRTTQPVEHDGKAIEVGALVDLPKAAAQALLACGSAEDPAAAERAEAEAQAAADKAAAEAKAAADAQAAADAAATKAAGANGKS